MPAPAFVFVENGSVTTPAGFLAAGVTAGFTDNCPISDSSCLDLV